MQRVQTSSRLLVPKYSHQTHRRWMRMDRNKLRFLQRKKALKPHRSYSQDGCGLQYWGLSVSVGLSDRVPQGGSRRRDQAATLPVRPLDDRGPVPSGEPVLVSSADPSQTLIHVAKHLTSLRRVLILGDVDCGSLDSIHPIHVLTDGDRFAVKELIAELCRDGGVPPVLLILGAQSVLDTGGASPSPIRELSESIADRCWCALFVPEDEPRVGGFVPWGYDRQAGWSKL